MRLVLAYTICVAFLCAQTRPKITGLAHIAVNVKDVEKSRDFYKDFLGYGEPFELRAPSGSLVVTFIKVNDRQYIELFPEREPNSDRLNHISVETDDAEAMRLYLAAKGIKVPDRMPRGRIGNLNFTIRGPDGHRLEFVQYEPASWSMREKGKFMHADRISTRMLHFGILVGSLDASMKFYGDLLGFKEIWRGSRDGETLNWVNMKVPNGDDYIEFMLYDKLPEPTRRGTAHHICLPVPDMHKALADLEKRRDHYNQRMEIRTGVNRRRQMNLYDPDGTRVELMEPKTVDGKPAPSSPAPPPRP